MMNSNYVLAIFFAQAKVKNRTEWDAALEAAWPKLQSEMLKNPGFKGMIAMWNADDSGEVSVIGLWETMEHRLEFEKRSATTARPLFEALMKQTPDRHKFRVTKSNMY